METGAWHVGAGKVARAVARKSSRSIRAMRVEPKKCGSRGYYNSFAHSRRSRSIYRFHSLWHRVDDEICSRTLYFGVQNVHSPKNRSSGQRATQNDHSNLARYDHSPMSVSDRLNDVRGDQNIAWWCAIVFAVQLQGCNREGTPF